MTLLNNKWLIGIQWKGFRVIIITGVNITVLNWRVPVRTSEKLPASGARLALPTGTGVTALLRLFLQLSLPGRAELVSSYQFASNLQFAGVDTKDVGRELALNLRLWRVRPQADAHGCNWSLPIAVEGYQLHSLFGLVGKKAPKYNPQSILSSFQPASTKPSGSAGAEMGTGLIWTTAFCITVAARWFTVLSAGK